MSFFSVPVMPLSGEGVTNTPKTMPVLFDEEHVADATLREGSYHFIIFRGPLETGLHDGTLFSRAKFRDSPPHPELPVRDYLAIEIIRNL